MRQSLTNTFPEIFAYDLSGSAKKVEIRGAAEDQNVFDIQQGVAILLARRAPCPNRLAEHACIMGTRSHKYRTLLEETLQDTRKVKVEPCSPYYFLIPRDTRFESEYEKFFPLSDAMPVHVCGITTARDSFVIGFEDDEVIQRVEVFLDQDLNDAQVMKTLGLSENYAWRVREARKDLDETPNWRQQIRDILYRPFDIRRIIYHPAVVWRPRESVMSTLMDSDNLGLCTNRQVNSTFQHVGISRWPINDCTLSLATKERTYVFPLWNEQTRESSTLISGTGKTLNFSTEFLSALSRITPMYESSDEDSSLRPLRVLTYIYAILHCPGYRARYSEQLKIDYPRIPVALEASLFSKISCLGENLVALHLLESPKVEQLITSYTGPKNPEVSRVGWSGDTVWLDAGKTNAREGHRAAKPGTIGFKGVPEQVWDFYIGGYQVCHKWLKDRKGRTLSDDDIAHYQKIIVALNETIRIMAEIDHVIDQHGGWPDAFQTGADRDDA